MKLLFIASVLAVFLAISEAKSCRSGADCGAQECCIRKVFFFGVCQNLATEGQSCSVEQENSQSSKYIGYCPCVSGLSCQPTSKIPLLPIKYNDRCVADVTTTPVTPEPTTIQPTTTPKE